MINGRAAGSRDNTSNRWQSLGRTKTEGWWLMVLLGMGTLRRRLGPAKLVRPPLESIITMNP